MATSTATVLVNVITNTKGAVDGMDKMAGKAGKFQGAMKKALVPAAAAGAVLIGFGAAAVTAASDAEQAFGGVDAVFGRNAKIVKRWAEGAADSVGLAKDEYARLATTIGGQLKAAGIPLDQATNKTKGLIGTAADLAATYGGTTKEAVEALGSAMRGEADPAEQFNLNLKEGKIAAEMAAQGTDKLKGSAKDAARMQALLSLVSKQSADAHGKFAKESETLANQQQKAAANWRNTMIDLGAALLPIMTKLASLLSVVAKWMAKNKTLVTILAAAVGVLVAAVLLVNAALWAMSLTPVALIIGGIAIAIGLVIVGLVMLYKKSTTARKIMNAVFGVIKSNAKSMIAVFKNVAKAFMIAFRVAVAAVKGYIRAWIAYFRLVFSVVRSIVKAVVSVFKGDWRGALSAVKDIIRAFRDFFRDIFNALPDPVQRVIEKIREGLGGAITWIKSKVSGLGDKLSAPFDAVKTSIGWLIEKIEDLISALGRIKVPSIKLPNLPGPLSFGKSAAPSTAGARGVSTFAAPGVAARGGGTTRSTSGGVTINVNGAIDPEATARQIQRILVGHDRRVGLRVS